MALAGQKYPVPSFGMSRREIMMNARPGDCFLIVGFGVTGNSLARFLDGRGFCYFIHEDHRQIDWQGRGFAGRFELSHVQGGNVFNFKAVFPSPGVSLTHPVIQWAEKNHIPLIGELELASFYLKGEFIAVTGTNGKSTTVTLISTLLGDAGIQNHLKGNIGSPLIDAVHEPPLPFYVVEESSYQLELAGSLRHKIAVCLNVSSDHFDRYAGIDEYRLAKLNIVRNSRSSDFFIYNHDDPFCLKMSRESPAKNFPFSLVSQFDEGAFIAGDHMVIRIGNREYRFDSRLCSLKGMHNLENMLSALSAVLLISGEGKAVRSYQNTLRDFQSLPHRMEKFCSARGIDFYDDSKATNVHAVTMALASFEKNVILILGGRDKNSDYSPLKGLVKAKVKKMILMGEAGEKIQQVLGGIVPTVRVWGMQETVEECRRCATDGDAVLLSPACSSFDQYENYKKRGEDFKQRVRQVYQSHGR